MPDNILVTGAGSGFGLLTVRTLLGTGFTVYAGIRDPHGRNAERAASLQTFAEGSSGDLEIVNLDVFKEADCRAAAEAMMARDGRVDTVFHNAGHLYIGYTEAFTPEQLSEAFRSNVLGAHILNRAVLPFMHAAGQGTLIYNSSGSARVVGPFMGPYVVGKMVFDALAEASAYEANAFGIKTVIIMPGAFTRGTSHFDTHAAPEDAEVVRAYARLQPDFHQYSPGLERLFEGREQPPQAVADEVARVLAIARGHKPLRTEVDFSEWGAGVCNVVAEYETTRLWGNMGLGQLLHVAFGQHESRVRS